LTSRCCTCDSKCIS